MLFLVQTYNGGPLDVRSVNSTMDVRETTQTYATFWNTPWLISKHTRHPLDRCAKVSNVR
jgi:hypothetical protein